MKGPTLKVPRPALPREPGQGVAPTPPEEEVSVGSFKVPKTKAGMAKFAIDKVNELSARMEAIQQAATRNRYENFRRIEANASVTASGLQKIVLEGPTTGSIYAIHRIILALDGADATTTVDGFPGLYKDRGTTRNNGDIFLPLYLPGTVGQPTVTTGVVHELPYPAVYRDTVADLALWANYGGTIPANMQVYVGLDVEVLPEQPTQLEIR